MKLETRQDYIKFIKLIPTIPEEDRRPLLRYLLKNDLYFLCLYGMGWHFYNCDFGFRFAKEVEANPYQLWLVARGHMKSLTITTAHNIQEILNNPDDSIAIISYNLKTAKAFLRQIKQELEDNRVLSNLFPEILYKNPKKESPMWNSQDGLLVKRGVTRKEPTFFAFGLVDSQATGFHFDVHSFDDVVTENSVTSDEMIMKTTERWQLSDNLGMMTERGTRKKYAGTRYHYFDTYKTIMDVGVPHTIIPATDNGEMDGKPIFLTQELLKQKQREQGSYMFSCQNLLKPIAKEDQKFTIDMKVTYKDLPNSLNHFIAVDPANAKSKQSDYTAMWVFGYSHDKKVYLADAIHDKLSLRERYLTLKMLNNKYRPMRIGYEKYGIQTDIDYMQLENSKDSYYMPLFEMKGSTSKEDRITRLVALFESGDILFPEAINYFSSFHKQNVNIVDKTWYELLSFPFGEHDDLIDCLARMYDVFLMSPNNAPKKEIKEEDKYTVKDRIKQRQLKQRKQGWD